MISIILSSTNASVTPEISCKVEWLGQGHAPGVIRPMLVIWRPVCVDSDIDRDTTKGFLGAESSTLSSPPHPFEVFDGCEMSAAEVDGLRLFACSNYSAGVTKTRSV